MIEVKAKDGTAAQIDPRVATTTGTGKTVDHIVATIEGMIGETMIGATEGTIRMARAGILAEDTGIRIEIETEKEIGDTTTEMLMVGGTARRNQKERSTATEM